MTLVSAVSIGVIGATPSPAAPAQSVPAVRARDAAAARAQAGVSGEAAVYDEQESGSGANNLVAGAELVDDLGTGSADNPRFGIRGELFEPAPVPLAIEPGSEDNGSISQATRTGINSAHRKGVVDAVIGDGPHGSVGDGTGDFDFYRVRARAGETINVGVGGFDAVISLWTSRGRLVDSNWFTGEDTVYAIADDVGVTGTYYVLVSGFSGFSPFPDDPFDSGSGAGIEKEGAYRLTIQTHPHDVDYYALDLAAGDVLGATVSGGANSLSVFGPDGRQKITANQSNRTGRYPAATPLPGGGNTTFAYVAGTAGRYFLRVAGPSGDYNATVETYRPGSEAARAPQTIYLDFTGQRINTSRWGGPGIQDLSPFSTFVERWGLEEREADRLSVLITRVVRENLHKDLLSTYPTTTVRVMNSQTAPTKLWGRKNVSRVVVAGTEEELDSYFVSRSQDIDPGNFDHEDEAIVLLDTLAGGDDPETDPQSINAYLRDGSDREAFVATAVGNLISHEIGHLVGAEDSDAYDPIVQLMDEPGSGQPGALYGVGPDGIGGTADDADVDLGTDNYANEAQFGGEQDSAAIVAWGLSAPTRRSSGR